MTKLQGISYLYFLQILGATMDWREAIHGMDGLAFLSSSSDYIGQQA